VGITLPYGYRWHCQSRYLSFGLVYPSFNVIAVANDNNSENPQKIEKNMPSAGVFIA
jgi:hypothetical protein